MSYRGTRNKMTGFLIRNHGGQKKVAQYFLMIKEKDCQIRTQYPAKMSFREEGELTDILS